jgi:hypothetical protein
VKDFLSNASPKRIPIQNRYRTRQLTSFNSIFAATLAGLLFCGCGTSLYQTGRRDAKRGIAQGVLAPADFGSPVWIYKDWQELLQQKYGIKIRWSDADRNDTEALDYFKGYNEVEYAEIEKRFGTNFGQRTLTEAISNHMRDHPAEAAAWKKMDAEKPLPLPADTDAKEFFQEHRSELTNIIAAVQREPSISFVSPEWVGHGADATNATHVACAKLLKEAGAMFARKRDGAIEIYFWGTGCAVCHDSYGGFAYIPPDAPLLRNATIVHSLENKNLPKGKYGAIQDGTYLVPLADGWYLVRWECG